MAAASIGWEDFTAYKTPQTDTVTITLQCLPHPEHFGDHYDIRFLNSTNRSIEEYHDEVFNYDSPLLRNRSYTVPRQSSMSLCIKSSLDADYGGKCRVVWSETIDGPKTMTGQGSIVAAGSEGFSIGGLWRDLKLPIYALLSLGLWGFWYMKLSRGAIRPLHVGVFWIVFSVLFWLVL
jgi:hypothetical protein